MPYNKLFVNLACSVYMYREISDHSLFVQTSPYGFGLYKKDLGPIFLFTDLAFG